MLLYCSVVYGSAQTIRVVSQIYRERTIGEVSANEEGLTSSNVTFVSVKLDLFSSNLQLNEMKWGTMKF